MRAPPPGLTDLRGLPELRFSIGYHRADNFTGSALPGYGSAGAWLLDPAADRLRTALDDLAPDGLTLLVFDAYRPVRATRAMVDWCERSGMAHLLNGYVGRTSNHNRGVAIDVGLAHRVSGAAVPMGTAWDAFVSGSAFDQAVGAARVHRRRLREAMTRAGFRPYDAEWWHFELALDPRPPALDVPYSLDEAD